MLALLRQAFHPIVTIQHARALSIPCQPQHGRRGPTCVTYGAASTFVANALKVPPTAPQPFVSVRNICDGCDARLASNPFDAYDRKPWPRAAASLGDRWDDAIDRPRFAGILARDRWPHGAPAPGFCESP